ncbi:MAG: flavodoxin domain-containing protein [Rubrobacteraceae bacterium]|nr:flavodoxin domain-containing protein [Rubrobacteraceae bacterium]
MKVLVTAASKHGATAEVAGEIGETLREALRGRADDIVVDVHPPEELDSVEDYDAVVLGSAVYAGHWMEQAREFARRHANALSTRPTWLFSVGPVGDPPKPEEEPVDVAQILEATKAREHRVFAGKLDRHALGFAEKAIVLALRAPEGDFRDWEEIRAWARGVAAELASS